MTKDPLLKASEDAQRALFENMSKVANGFSVEHVIGASANMLINAIRQSQSTRGKAETQFDELFGRMKAVLLDHYDGLGRKRGVFPYTQTIHANLFSSRNTFGGKN